MSVEDLQTANKLWWRRLQVVWGMSDWVGQHLSPSVVVDGHAFMRSPAGRKRKGSEYVYCHLFLGKTIFPDGLDPLFTGTFFEDVSLRTQLEFDGESAVSEIVVCFWTELRRLQRTLLIDSRLCTDSVVTRPTLPRDASAVIDQLQSRLPADATANEHIIGLIVRYMCVGGFDSNQHASIAGAWAAEFPKMIECFASPLNHVFDDYFSLFDDDRCFGSSGNFFREVARIGGVLADENMYEMNPPFEETILDMASTIVCKTFSRDCSVKLVMFVPDWKDSSCFKKLHALFLQQGPRFASMHIGQLGYQHVSGRNPPVDSCMFVFVGKRCADPSDFINRCQSLMAEYVVEPPVGGARGTGLVRGGARGRGTGLVRGDARGRGSARGVGSCMPSSSFVVQTLGRIVDFIGNES